MTGFEKVRFNNSGSLGIGEAVNNNTITFNAQDNEMIRVTPDGFYVRGEKVPCDADESKTVYEAFKQFLTWSALVR